MWIRLLLVFLAMMSVAGQARADNIGAAGDIASDPTVVLRNDEATARLVEANGIGKVLALGDTQYECANMDQYLGGYEKSWGRFKAKTMAAIGNHEYLETCPPVAVNAGATEAAEESIIAGFAASPQSVGGLDFFAYFGERACPLPGWCSFRYQGWDFFVLNTTFGALSETQKAEQLAWFKSALRTSRASGTKCQVVYGHHPYKATRSPFSGTPELVHYWPSMVIEGVDLYLAGHNHSYERGKPMRTAGNVDYTFGPGSGGDGLMGVRWVVVGTGGRSLIPFTGVPQQASAFRLAERYGIFKIVPNYVAPNSFLTAFKGVDGSTHDRVSWGCH